MFSGLLPAAPALSQETIMSKTPTDEMVAAAQEAYATFGQVGHLRAQPPAANVVAAMLSAALQSAAETPAPEYHHVGWVHSFPSPRFGVETFFSQFEPTGNVDWQKVYVRAPREDWL
jgi:hypothetical protein